jgi:YD repeat-containing protein
MKHAVRMGLWLGLLCLALACWGTAVTQAAPVAGGVGAGAVSGVLAVPGVQMLDGGQQLRAAEEAASDNPQVAAQRVVSRTKFAHLNAREAEQTAARSFPETVSAPAAGVPPPGPDATISGYLGPRAAKLTLSDGETAVMVSAAPLAAHGTSGKWTPIDLHVHETGGAFAAVNSEVGVRIPKHLREGVQIGAAGLSLTPVGTTGASLTGSEGVANGTSVFFANTQTDSDTVLKPLATGVDASTVLRSAASPETLDFRVGFPRGDRIVQPAGGGGVIEVLAGRTRVGLIPLPTAEDASGAPVPVKMAVSGRTLSVTVNRRSGSYLYPLVVDPEFVTEAETLSNEKSTEGAGLNWHLTQAGGYESSAAEESLSLTHIGSWSAGDYGFLSMQAKGYAKIYALTGIPFYNDPGQTTAWMTISGGGEGTHERFFSEPLNDGAYDQLCTNASCTPSGDSGGDAATVEVTTLASGGEASSRFSAGLSHVVIYLAQERGKHSEASLNANRYVEYEEEGHGKVKELNVLYGGGLWFGPHNGATELKATDGGLGISEMAIEREGSKGWESEFYQLWGLKKFLRTSSCSGLQCTTSQYQPFTYNSLGTDGGGGLPNGEYPVRAVARSAMPNSDLAEHGGGEAHEIKVDNTPPHGIVVSGLPSVKRTREELYGYKKEYEALQLGETEAHITVEASDGEGTTPSSGVRSIAIGIDGKEVGSAGGSCSRGPCAASHEWSVNGAELGVGEYTLTVTATDNANNVATKEYALEVYHASPITMGPGSVNPESGDFAMEATDASVSGGLGALTLSRHYDSRNLTEGGSGPLGPQWSVGLGSLAELEVLPDGSVMVIGPEGLTHFATKTGGGFEAPEGDTNLTLEYEPKKPAYLVKDPKQGTTTEFTLPKGAKNWLPTVSEGPVATDKLTDEYKTVELAEGKVLVEPTLELAAHPSATCSHAQLEKLEIVAKGCRALEFVYTEGEGTAKGEAESGWGTYKHRLKEVDAIAYNPVTKAMARTAVVEYEWDGRGYLAAEWNPEITPALKTTYGYDAEGHIAAVTPPGQEGWALTYGTIIGDTTTGRLLKITRAPTTAALWKGELPAKSETPVISGTPVVGIKLAVSNGKWTGSPFAYGYEWEDCNSSGEACVPITGATNPNYTVAQSDVGHKLVAVVSATNGGGTVTAASAATHEATGLDITEYTSTDTGGIAAGPDGNLWLTGSTIPKNFVSKMTTSGASTTWELGSEFAEPGFITSGPEKESALWFTTETANEIGKITTAGTVTGYHVAGGDWPAGIAAGPENEKALWFAALLGSKVGKITTSGTVSEYALPKESLPIGMATAPEGEKAMWFTEEVSQKIGRITTAGAITEYGLPGGSYPYGIAAGPEKEKALWFTDTNSAMVGKITTAGAVTEYALPAGSSPGQIAPGPDNEHAMWFTESGTARLGKITTAGVITEYALPAESQPNAITPGPSGERAMWFTAHGTGKVGKVTLAGIPEGEARAPAAGTTIEYNVPLEGSGAPQQMGINETTKKPEPEAWGQKDNPVDAAAVFRPDEPMGWPATDYKHATVLYMDSEARAVNSANPAGGITTTEFNENSEVTRTLSADNRATALKEPNPPEAAELLSTENEYNSEGLLASTLGPRHPVRLAVGEKGPNEEALARDHISYFYNEGAKAVEEAKKESYDLVTKTIDGAKTASGEFDKRTTLTSYSGQGDLGWTLRQATSTTVNPEGLAITHTTEYNEAGDVTETKAPEGTAEVVYPSVYEATFGSAGSGSGQFKNPEGSAVDAMGDVWVADEGNSRIEKFSSTGTVIGAYGSKGSGAAQFSEPFGVAVNRTPGSGAIYVTDSGNNRIVELNAGGEFLEAIGWGVSDGKAELEVCKSSCKAGIAGSGSGQLNGPSGVTIDSAGNIWVVDGGNDRVEEFSAEGKYLAQFGSKGSGNGQLSEPAGIAIAEGEVYVVDYGNDRVEEFSPTGGYLAQFGSKGSGTGQLDYPVMIAVNSSSGDLYVSDAGNSRIEEFSPAGRYLTEFGTWGTGKGQLEDPTGLAVSATGKLYVSDQYNQRISEWQPQGAGGARMIYNAQIGTEGSGNGQFKYPVGDTVDGQGDLWVTDFVNDRIQEFSSTGKFIAAYGTKGSGHNQFEGPTGIAVNQSTGNVYVADCSNHRIDELSSAGAYVRTFGTAGSEPGEMGCPNAVTVDPSGNVWVVDGEHARIEEYSSTGTFIATYGKAGSGEAQFESPSDLAFSGGNIYVVDDGNHRVEELSSTGKYISQFGSEGHGSGEFAEASSIAADSAGNLYVTDSSDRVEEFNQSGAFLASFASTGSGEGQLSGPIGIAINAAGSMYVVDAYNNRIEQWIPISQAVHDTQTIYYTAKEEAEVGTCRNHPEWVGLPCQRRPLAQPSSTEPTVLPVTTVEYNMWDQPETIEEAFGSVIRTKKTEFDKAGRPTTIHETSSIDTKLPKVTDTYNTTNGTLETQTAGEPTKTLTTLYNTLNQPTSYTDAEGNTATYEYETEKDERLTKVSDAKGYQTFSYNETTSEISEVHDSAAGTFTAARDVEGLVASETYPDGLTAHYTRSAEGEATKLEYTKTTHCTEKCIWFSDSIVQSIHGETLAQKSTLSEEPAYTYGPAGELTGAEEIPAGEGCKTRLYAWDEEGNRTSETTREPAGEGKCATEGGTTERHVYDNTNGLTDPGTEYETFGNTTVLPGPDAGGAPLEASYYLDNQVLKQSQNGETIEYKLDPEGRPIETISSGKAASSVVSHYDGPGNALSWTSESSEKWTRNIAGIGGELAAVQTNPGQTVLELHDLQGNVVATAGLSEAETGLLTKYNSTEFGVPTTKEKPPTYAWLGADGVTSELTSGAITQDGVTYVPQTGRPLQTQAVEVPTPASTATPFVSTIAQWVIQAGIAASAHQVALAEEARRAAQGPEDGFVEAEGAVSAGSATGATAASVRPSCSYSVIFGEAAPLELFAGGQFTCNRQVTQFQIEVCVLAENPETGKFVNVKGGCNHEGRRQGQVFPETRGGKAWVILPICGEGLNYRAWVWGAILGDPIFAGQGTETAAVTCTGRGGVDDIESTLEWIKSLGEGDED